MRAAQHNVSKLNRSCCNLESCLNWMCPFYDTVWWVNYFLNYAASIPQYKWYSRTHYFLTISFNHLYLSGDFMGDVMSLKHSTEDLDTRAVSTHCTHHALLHLQVKFIPFQLSCCQCKLAYYGTVIFNNLGKEAAHLKRYSSTVLSTHTPLSFSLSTCSFYSNQEWTWRPRII